MDPTVPRLEEVRAIGHAIAVLRKLDEQETHLLIELIEWHERANADRTPENQEEHVRLLHEAPERVMAAYVEYCVEDLGFWASHPGGVVTDDATDQPEQFRIKGASIALATIPPGQLVMTCSPDRQVGLALTIVLPVEDTRAIYGQRSQDPVAFNRLIEQQGKMMWRVATILLVLWLTGTALPEDAARLEEKLRELLIRFQSETAQRRAAAIRRPPEDPPDRITH
jgi:hypothetical protein